jgi:hypothetical protein
MLWKQVQACQASTDQGYIQKVIDSRSERVEAVRQARGEVTWFWKLDLVVMMYMTLSLAFICTRMSIGCAVRFRISIRCTNHA